MRLDEFEAVVDRTIEDLPDWVIEGINNLVVVTEEHPSPELGDVLGVYEGISLTEREEYSGVLPDRIVIFRQPHLHTGLAGPDLEAEIRKTVLHEIGHHLGLSEVRLAELGWD